MITKILHSVKILVYVLVVLSPNFVFAFGEATIETIPKEPKPFSIVTLNLVSYLFNVNTSLITWTVNGKEVLKGVGEKKLNINMGGVGDHMKIHVLAINADQSIGENEIDLTPSSVDIVYEVPESYTPLFYEGHTLPGEGAQVKFIAMPNMEEKGKMLSPSSLSYSWYINDEYIDKASGLGKQSALLNLDTLSNITSIRVMVHTPLGVIAEKTVDMYPHEILPLLYTYDDILGGNYNTLLKNRFETTQDFKLLLEPFFASTKNMLDGAAIYTWTLDGFPITPLGGRILALQPKKSSYGSRKLSISVLNNKRRLQEAVTNLNLIFDTR